MWYKFSSQARKQGKPDNQLNLKKPSEKVIEQNTSVDNFYQVFENNKMNTHKRRFTRASVAKRKIKIYDMETL